MDVLTQSYSHVIGSTAHEQMSKINGLFEAPADNQTEAVLPKQSIKKQLDEAKQQPKPPAKQPQKGAKKKDYPER